MLTKVQIEILKVFASKINEKFSINQIAKGIGKAYSLVHRSFKKLLIEKYLAKDSHGLLSLNYKMHVEELAYIESLRTRTFSAKYSLIASLSGNFSQNYKGMFICLVFGSAVEKKNPRDIDILFIVNDEENAKKAEKTLDFLLTGFPLKVHPLVISMASFDEMLRKREELNIINETLNKHIILFGAESYYETLKNAR